MATILIVDEDAAQAAGLGALMRARGFDTCIANGGREGLQKYRASRPPLVIVEMEMSGFDGPATASAIRNSALTSQPMLIALSRLRPRESRRAAMDAGFDAYLTRPINLDGLVDVTEKLLLDAGRRTIGTVDGALLASPLSPSQIDLLKSIREEDAAYSSPSEKARHRGGEIKRLVALHMLVGDHVDGYKLTSMGMRYLAACGE